MPSEFCRYCGAGIGALRRIGEGTCPKCDPQPKLLAAEINALPKRVRDFIHHLETDADPAGDKWRLAAAEENVAGLAEMLRIAEKRIEDLEAAFDGPELPL